MRLSVLRHLWLLLLLGALVVLAALAVWGLHVADLEDALVQEANEIVAAPRARPVHVSAASPGSFADALRDSLPRYEMRWKALEHGEETTALLSAVAKGDRPSSDLSPEVAAGLASLDRDLDAVLRASRAERADLGPDHDPFGPFRGTSWLGVQAAAKHAAIRIKAGGAAMDPARALRDCLDGLALGRDAAISGGLIGRLIHGSITAWLTSACGDAISLSDAAAVRDTGRILRQIQAATPSFAATVREEGIQVQLLVYGPLLSEKAKERLRDRPRAFAEDGSMALSGALGPLRSRLAWRGLRQAQRAMADAAELPPELRESSFDDLGRSFLLVRALLGYLNRGDNWARYSRIDDAADRRMGLLVAGTAAREFEVRHGKWPSDLSAMVAEGLLVPREALRVADLVLREERGGRRLRLAIPVPQVDVEVPAEEVIRVSRSGVTESP